MDDPKPHLHLPSLSVKDFIHTHSWLVSMLTDTRMLCRHLPRGVKCDGSAHDIHSTERIHGRLDLCNPKRR